jgi:tetratricopeptide (TPR) repeat protein
VASLLGRFRKSIASPIIGGGFIAACVIGASAHAVSGCSGWDPTEPFERNAPDFDRAIDLMDAGDFESAQEVIAAYLGTGTCSSAGIGLPEAVRQKPDGSFDLGLILFYLGEKFGRQFGDEEKGDPEKDDDPEEVKQRRIHIDCALTIVKAIGADPDVAMELRARAYYLAGNLEFLRRRYEDAIKFYDQALRFVPGIIEEAGGDGIGRDAAHNRAVALRRLEQDGGADGNDGDDGADGNDGNDGDDGADGSDGADGADAPEDGPNDGGDGGDEDGGDAAADGGDAGDGGNGGPDGGKDGGADAGPDGAPQDNEPDAGDPRDQDPNAPPVPTPTDPDGDEDGSAEEDDRLLDEFEQAPTYQEQEAKKRAVGRRRTMEDK